MFTYYTPTKPTYVVHPNGWIWKEDIDAELLKLDSLQRILIGH